MSDKKEVSFQISNSEYEFLRYQSVIHNCSPTSYIKKLIVADMKLKHQQGSIK